MQTRADKVYVYLYWFVDVVWSLALFLGVLLMLAIVVFLLVTLIFHPGMTFQDLFNLLSH